MTERYDHRDDEARVADADVDDVIDKPVMHGADDLQTEAIRSADSEDDREDATDEGSVEG